MAAGQDLVWCDNIRNAPDAKGQARTRAYTGPDNRNDQIWPNPSVGNMNYLKIPQWFESGEEPEWFKEAIKEWRDSTVTMPD